MLQSTVKSGWLAIPTLQQPTTPAIMDMSWMVHTLGNASMMVLGMERLQYAVHQREVSTIIIIQLLASINYKYYIPSQLPVPSLLHHSMERLLWQATPTLQQPTTLVIMDMRSMARTLGNASTMVLGLERPLNAAKQREVSTNKIYIYITLAIGHKN